MSNVCLNVRVSQDVTACGEVVLSAHSHDTENKKVIKPCISLSVVKRPSKKTVIETVSLWMQRSRQRKQLAQLDPYRLNDLGLSEERVKNEIAKPFWK